ncbi:MAG: alpha/beta hydrolase [Leptospirales bacterium]|nr:alpha/beta hydrolase [Leptospirales bacterium]
MPMRLALDFQLSWKARLLLAGVLIALALPAILADGERQRLSSQERSGAAPADQFVQLSDGVTHFEISGPAAGKPVILVCGLASPVYIWDRSVEGLTAAGFRVLRYDLYGRGLSDRPRRSYNLQLFLRQLSELRQKTGFDRRADIIGLSMGGVIVTGHVLERPEWIGKVALISPAGFPLELPARARLASLPALGDWMILSFGDQMLLRGLHTNLERQGLFENYRRSFAAQMRYAGFKAALLSSLRSMPLQSMRLAYLQAYSVQRPLLLIWGKQDQVIPLSVGQQMAAEIPGVIFRPIEGAGHVSNWEAPELVNPLLLERLRSP